MGLIYDGVLYNGEADVLECRLTELAGTVHKFVIVEGDKSFTGKPRVRANRDRFLPWSEQIVWVDYETPVDASPWKVETATRNRLFDEFAKLGVQDCDVVTVCDADEIWVPSMADSFSATWCAVLMRHLIFSVHWEGPMELTCVAGPWGQRDGTADHMRRGLRQRLPQVAGGWHVGWMGGPAWCAEKIRQFSHQEFNVDDVDAKMIRCFQDGVFIEGSRLEEREIGGDWPAWIRAGKHPQSWRWRR